MSYPPRTARRGDASDLRSPARCRACPGLDVSGASPSRSYEHHVGPSQAVVDPPRHFVQISTRCEVTPAPNHADVTLRIRSSGVYPHENLQSTRSKGCFDCKCARQIVATFAIRIAKCCKGFVCKQMQRTSQQHCGIVAMQRMDTTRKVVTSTIDTRFVLRVAMLPATTSRNAHAV